MSIEAQLRDTLFQAADELGRPEPPPTVRAMGMLVLSRRRRRRRAAVLSAGLAAVLVAVAVPVGLSVLQSDSVDERAAAPSRIPPADIFGAPPRGSLAADAAFVEAIRQLPWAWPDAGPGDGEMRLPDPPLETRSVVFAGDVTGGRWALVVGQNTAQPTGNAADGYLLTDIGALSDIAGAWFVGPPGAAPEQMLLATIPRGIPANLPASLHDAATGALVLVAAPDDVIEVSPRPEVAADGTVSRTFRDTNSTDGVAVIALDANPYQGGMPAPAYRVTRRGVEEIVIELNPDTYSDPDGEQPPGIALNYLRPPAYSLPEGAASGEEQRLAAEVLASFGLRAGQVGFDVHYVGAVPGVSGAAAELTVLSATFPSGAVRTTAFWLQSIPETPGVYGAGFCTESITSVGVPAAQQVLAMRCDIGNDAREAPAPVSTLVVIAPVELGAATAAAQGGSDTGEVHLADGGVGMIELPDGAQSVLIQAADGMVLDEVPIRSYSAGSIRVDPDNP